MDRLALLLKSYEHDLEYAKRMVASFDQFNRDGLTLFVVVPATDLAAFTALAGPHVTVMSDEPFLTYFTEVDVHGTRPGYINQEIVKLAFWELGLAENYFCIDSDAQFIRPFGASDFMFDEHTPYSVLVEDNELKVEPRYYEQYWRSRDREIRHIQQLVGLHDPIVRTCHGHQVLSAKVLRSFKEEFLQPRGWTYLDALAESPYEFSWYNMWLQKARPIDIHVREPLVKVFHHEGQHLEYILRGISVNDIARGYVALVINSNYSRDLGLVSADGSKPRLVSQYLSYGEVGGVLSAKVRETFRRRLRRSEP